MADHAFLLGYQLHFAWNGGEADDDIVLVGAHFRTEHPERRREQLVEFLVIEQNRPNERRIKGANADNEMEADVTEDEGGGKYQTGLHSTTAFVRGTCGTSIVVHLSP